MKNLKIIGYKELLHDIKSLIEKARYKVYKAVDNLLVQTYWQIGERIARETLLQKRADYGKQVIPRLAIDINMQKSALYDTLRFYNAYPIFHAVRGELSWTHYRLLMRIKDKNEREFYESQIIQSAWSSRKLEKQIRSKLYQRAKKKGTLTIKTKLPVKLEPEQIFKDVYNFDFLDLKKKHSEDELKKALILHLEKFLHELGADFFVGGREVPILIGGNYDKIDLVLFHTGLLCYILVEVKIEPFKHSHVSQMYSSLNWYKENKWQEPQRPPIGLIVCKTKDEETVHYALGGLKKEIFVAEYKTKLPSEEQIKKVMRKVRLD